MGTRAVYTFSDNRNTFHVYKHYDGYQSGAAEFFVKALKLAWELPRFEAAEFAAAFAAASTAAFIAANKTGGGDVYLTTHWDDHGDLAYRYELSQSKNGQLIVRVFENTISGYKELFYGRLKDFVDSCASEEIKNMWNNIDKSENKLKIA